MFYKIFQFSVRHGLNIRTLTRLGFIFKDSNPLCNGRCRNLVVSCNHHRLDSGPDTFCYRSFGLFSWRIHHRDQTEECQVIFIIFYNLCLCLQSLICKSENSKSLSGEILIDTGNVLPVLICDRLFLTISAYFAHSSRKNIHSAFDKHDNTLTRLMYGRHELSVTVKWHFRDSSIFLPDLFHIHSTVSCKGD